MMRDTTVSEISIKMKQTKIGEEKQRQRKCSTAWKIQ